MKNLAENVALSQYTSWLVGGYAEYFILPQTIRELQEAQTWAQDKKLPITILGGGSNVLISDQGIKGLVISLRNLKGAVVTEDPPKLKISALSGTTKSELLKIFLKYQLPPALFLAGIPGDVGGGVVMNAGVSEGFLPREFVEIVDWVEVLKENGELKTYATSDLKWEYRHSFGWQPGIITRVGLSWPMAADNKILEKVKDANRNRLAKQPLDKPSCGSVFVNPEGHKAAQLIDSCGLKGFTIGGAQVSEKHANFIVNIRSAKASEIWQIIEHIQATVLQKKNVKLQTEVIKLGSW